MSARDLLETDVGSLTAWAARAADGWWGELVQLVPAAWRARFRSRHPVADLGVAGQSVRLWRDGRIVQLAEGRSRPMAARLAAPPAQVLLRTVRLPPLPAADLRRLVALELDRLTPLREDEVYFDVERLEEHEGPAGTVRLGVIRREAVDAALARAERFGLTPLGLGAMDGDRLRFDFLRDVRGRRPQRRAALLWAAAGVLAAVNVGVAVWKDMDDVAFVRQAVELQKPSAALAVKLRARVERENAARRDLIARRDWGEPLRLEDAATRAFPAPQWIDRLEWNGRSLRLAGLRDPRFDVLAAVQAQPTLGVPRTLSNGQAAAGVGKAPFDLIAEPVRGRP
jgi:hypothetical protein